MSDTKENNGRISVDINKAIENMSSVRTIDFGGTEIHVKKYLTMSEAFSYVARVVSSVFGEDGTFQPEAGDVVQRIALIESYTDLALPESASDAYALLFCTDIVSRVMGVIDLDQYNTLSNAISNKIRYSECTNTSSVEMRLENMMTQMNVLEQKFESLFDGIDKETMDNFVKAFANGDFTEQGLVDALKITESKS